MKFKLEFSLDNLSNKDKQYEADTLRYGADTIIYNISRKIYGMDNNQFNKLKDKKAPILDANGKRIGFFTITK